MPASPEQTRATCLALLGEIDGVAHAVFLAAQGEAMFGLVGLHIRDEVEIEAVADPVGRGLEGGSRGRRAPVRRAGADADDMHDAPRAARQVEDRRG